MATKIEKFTISTKGFDDLIDITSKVQDIVSNSNFKEGMLNVCVVSSTASLLTMEYEPGLVVDLPKLFQNIVPINHIYQHDNTWHDGNAFAHLRAALIGNTVSLPIIDGKIVLNTWQQIVLIDFDNKASVRQIVVTITN